MSSIHKFEIIDTLKWNKKDGFIYKDFHITRTWDTFQFYKIHTKLNKYELVEMYDQLEQQNFSSNEVKIRLSFSKEISLKHSLEVLKLDPIQIPIHLHIQDSLFLPTGVGKNTFKTTDRQHWDLLMNFKSSKADDVVSVNTAGNFVETSRFNLFFYDQTIQVCMTPPLESGCLRGVFRAKSLKEKIIFLPDLNKKVPLIEKDIPILTGKKLSVYVGNSVRDAVPAVFI